MLTVEVLMEHSNGSVLVSAEDDMLDKPREIPAKVGIVVRGFGSRSRVYGSNLVDYLVTYLASSNHALRLEISN
jgi:hypothetical protein